MISTLGTSMKAYMEEAFFNDPYIFVMIPASEKLP